MDKPAPHVRIGVDVGGTFTDLVLHDPARDLVHTGKLLTTPEDPSVAIIEGLARLLREAEVSPGDVHSVVHGTTLVTNAIIERKGATVGLLTTEGFRDSIEIGRETRYDLYDLFLEPCPPLVPRRRRLEIPERISVDGDVVLALSETAVADAVGRLVEEERIEALAIAFMHSYRLGTHEQQAAAIARSLYPNLPITLSSEVAPEIREFERTSTACANAYVQPLMQRYLDRLERALREAGFPGRLYVMLSAGGITTVREARSFPIRLIESGPAAGAMASSLLAQLCGLDHVVSFDMGGTTAKMCLVENGLPDRKFEFEAGRVRRFQKGSGLPLKVSVIDMIEIGAGGGSLAYVEPGSRLLKVGPRSAGARPGPVCYGNGGTQPTVTDADLLLGRLNPDYFLGGEMRLDRARVEAAFASSIEDTLGLNTERSALGVQRIVDETMAAATRLHFAEKGRDPRNHTLIAFGGAGPVHACRLAELLKINRVVVPLGAGVASALGFLVAPPATDMVQSYVTNLAHADWERVSAIFAEMQTRGYELLIEAGVEPADIVCQASADMRHVGQGFEIPVSLPGLALSAADIPAIREAFFAAYRTRFERSVDDVPIEAISWRLSCRAPAREIRLGAQAVAAKDATPEATPRGVRKVLFEGHGWLECAVYDRYALRAGARFAGPAVIEERELTCVVGPNAWVGVDALRNLIVELA